MVFTYGSYGIGSVPLWPSEADQPTLGPSAQPKVFHPLAHAEGRSCSQQGHRGIRSLLRVACELRASKESQTGFVWATTRSKAQKRGPNVLDLDKCAMVKTPKAKVGHDPLTNPLHSLSNIPGSTIPSRGRKAEASLPWGPVLVLNTLTLKPWLC